MDERTMDDHRIGTQNKLIVAICKYVDAGYTVRCYCRRLPLLYFIGVVAGLPLLCHAIYYMQYLFDQEELNKFTIPAKAYFFTFPWLKSLHGKILSSFKQIRTYTVMYAYLLTEKATHMYYILLYLIILKKLSHEILQGSEVLSIERGILTRLGWPFVYGLIGFL